MIVNTYFNINRTLLLTIGLWPYQKSKLARLQFIGVVSILTTSIILQLTTFITSKCTTNLIVKVLSVTFALITAKIKYISFCINSGTVKYVMEYLQYIYNNLKDNNEIVIIEKYGSKGKRYTVLLTTFYVIVIFIQMGIQLWPNFYDIVLPVNGSRQYRLQIVTEYFINQRYFYLLLHINTSLFIAAFILLATGTILNTCFYCACGMFKIASYRIEKAMKIHYVSQDIILQNLSYKDIICAIDIQRKTIMFTKYLNSRFDISFMFLIGTGVMSLTFNIYRIISLDYNIKELVLPAFILSFGLLYLFLANFLGQNITDHYNHVFDTTYKVRWYLAPLHVQKLILFLMQRGNKTFGLTVGGLFVSSLECFATLLNTSLSYFMVLYSVQ